MHRRHAIGPPRRRLLYHFTHERNLKGIVEAGRLVSDSVAQAEGVIAVEVGDRAVKVRRRRMAVTAGPGGCPADYVPFYFAPRSPMLYVIYQGRVPEYQEGQDPLVYLVTDIDRVVAAGRPFVYSDGNCASALTEYSADLAGLDTLVDWPLMGQPMWNDTLDDPDRMRRRMAEFLVHQHLPWDAIIGIAVRNKAAAQRVNAILDTLQGARTYVRVRSDWYY